MLFPPLRSFQLYISTPYSARPYLRVLLSNPTALSRSVLFAKVAVHTCLKTCQCLDALLGNPGAPVDPVLVGSTVLAESFEMLDLLAEIWSSLPVLSSIPGGWPPSSLLAVSS